jgi:hypothetical protein
MNQSIDSDGHISTPWLIPPVMLPGGTGPAGARAFWSYRAAACAGPGRPEAGPAQPAGRSRHTGRVPPVRLVPVPVAGPGRARLRRLSPGCVLSSASQCQ